MALKINHRLTAQKLIPKIERLFELSAGKILSLDQTWAPAKGTPVFTAKGKYTSRGWTEWTQGFQFGSALLQFDATGDERFLEIGRRNTIKSMASHVSHIGVHDHGFNNLSTYGNLWRLMREGKLPFNEREQDFYELALKVSGAIQAARWTKTSSGGGFIYSFNGPHSLFVDTLRSLRSLAVAHQLGHRLMGEHDEKISLLRRLVEHGLTSAEFSVYYGAERDAYDVRGRVAHEIIFNTNDGNYRCPNSQQGFSPFSTWTRGLAWAILGFAEELEFLRAIPDSKVAASRVPPGTAPARAERTIPIVRVGAPSGKHARSESYAPVAVSGCASESPRPLANDDPGAMRGAEASNRNPAVAFLKAATATADFYLANSCADGIPMWDTGAPNLPRLGDYLSRPADPFNAWEPVDSSAAAIAAQGLVRLGNYLSASGDKKNGARYRQAGLTVAQTLFDEPYLSTNSKRQGLLLHSIYHRPNGWDYIAPGQKVPNGESSMWGDYHARELALLLWREARGESYLTFFDHTLPQ